MGNDPNVVSMRERVRVVKVDLEHPEKEPEIIEQETLTKISLDDAAVLGFTPGQGFRQAQPGDDDGPSICEGAAVGDQ